MSVVCFTTKSCQFCKPMKNYLESLGKEVEFLDAYDHPEMVKSCNVKSVPVLLKLKGDQVIDRVDGFNPSKIKEFFGDGNE